jgi:hypothetical protein
VRRLGWAVWLAIALVPAAPARAQAPAPPLGYRGFFKDGSEPVGSAQLVHQITRLEGHGRTFAIAVMTDGDPTMQYGIDTIAGVTQALLG